MLSSVWLPLLIIASVLSIVSGSVPGFQIQYTYYNGDCAGSPVSFFAVPVDLEDCLPAPACASVTAGQSSWTSCELGIPIKDFYFFTSEYRPGGACNDTTLISINGITAQCQPGDAATYPFVSSTTSCDSTRFTVNYYSEPYCQGNFTTLGQETTQCGLFGTPVLYAFDCNAPQPTASPSSAFRNAPFSSIAALLLFAFYVSFLL